MTQTASSSTANRPGLRVAVPLCLALLAVLTASAALAQPGEIKFDQDSFEVFEEAGVAVIRVERSRGEDGPVSVRYATSAGSATAGADYQDVSGQLQWPSGDRGDRTFEIPLIDDGDAEGRETVQLSLSNPGGGAVISSERGTSVLVILASDGAFGGDDNGGDDNGGDDNGGDDNGGNDGSGDDARNLLKFDQRNFIALESSGRAVITVERSRGEDGAVSVDWQLEPVTAQAGSDYQDVSGTLSWADGDGTVKTFEVPLVVDSTAEPTEHLRLRLVNPTGGGNLDGERSVALLTILDDDQGNAPAGAGAGELEVDDDAVVIEGEGPARVKVERSRGARGVVSVAWSLADGSAQAGEDYQAVSGVLSWGNGDASDKFIEVPILDDDLTEGNETVLVSLSSPSGGAVLDDSGATEALVILDDDGSTALCSEDSDTLCLAGERFRVEVTWRTGAGDSGPGQVIPQAGGSSGLVWFFQPDNVEMLIKVLNACGVPGLDGYWVFFAATTDVDFTVRVTDTATGVTREYLNPQGRAAEPVQDTLTFRTCP